MSKVKITLISDVPPDSKYTGGQVLRKIMKTLPGYEWNFFWLNQSNLPLSEDVLEATYYTNFQLGPSALRIHNALAKLCLGSSRIKKGLQSAFRMLKAAHVGWALSKKVNASDCDYVWMVLQGEVLAVTYWMLAIFSNKKLILHQWDPISWWSAHRQHSRLKKQFVSAIVAKIEAKVFLNIIPSHAWQDLQSKAGWQSHRIDNFFTLEDRLSHPTIRDENTLKSEIHAVFIGQLYSNDELTKTLSALNNYAASKDKKVIIHYFGLEKPEFYFDNIQVIIHGFLPREELIATIGQWDFALLPYPMAEKFSMASLLSFPSKSRMYLAAGLPILSMAKLDSSPHKFYSKNIPEHYLNLFDKSSNLESFIEKTTVRSLESTERRFKAMARVLADNFSEAAELDPLKAILEKNL